MKETGDRKGRVTGRKMERRTQVEKSRVERGGAK